MANTQQAVGHLITKMRESAGLSKNKLAEAIGVTSASIVGWEKGKGKTSVIDWCNICVACGVANAIFDDGTHLRVYPHQDEIQPQLIKLKDAAARLYETYRNPNAKPDDSNVIDKIIEHIFGMDEIGMAMNAGKRIVKDDTETIGYAVLDNELRSFTLVEGPGENNVTHYRGGTIAAGFSGVTESCATPCHIQELQNNADVGILEVSGDSMTPLYENGDTIVVENRLLHLGDNFVSMTTVKALFPEGTVAAFSLNGETAIKKIHYNGGDDAYGLWLVAENESWNEDYPRMITKDDDLILFGKVIGTVTQFQ